MLRKSIHIRTCKCHILACLASKPQKYPVTRTCKPKKIYNCATVLLQICNDTIAQLQTNLIYFIPSLSSSIFVSLLSLNIPSLSLLIFQASLSHISLTMVVFSGVGHGFGMGLMATWSSGGMEVFLDWRLAWLMGFSLTAVLTPSLSQFATLSLFARMPHKHFIHQCTYNSQHHTN